MSAAPAFALRTGARRRFGAAVLTCWLGLLGVDTASGFGAEGHRIAGQVAQTRLCEQAAARVAALSGGQGLDELGVWADRIRSEARWAHTGPWHYMNVADELPLDRYRSPPQGDILSAIAHFSQRLGDEALAPRARLDALRFVTHFVVDLHQPLHVGRAADRGGNAIRVVTGDGDAMNLHRFWDSEAIRLAGLTQRAYVDGVLGLVEQDAGRWEGLTPLDWARESRDLRSRVYAVGEPGAPLSAAYLQAAAAITRVRLAQAAVRLASEINRALCAPPP